MKRSWIVGVISILIYCFILKYMFHVFFPFVMALINYFAMKPLVDYFERYFHIQRSAIGVSLLLIIYFIFALLLAWVLTVIVFYFKNFIENIPYFYQNIFLPLLQQFTHWYQDYFAFWINPDDLQFFQNLFSQSLLQIATFLSSFLTQIPTYLFSFFLFVISTFFLMIDYDSIKTSLLSLMNQQFLESFILLKSRCLKSLWLYIKSQMILMTICFVILFFGFWILRMEHPFSYAILTALLDSLPFIGVGIILIPLSIIFLLNQSYLMAIYIILLYLIINVVRSILEPQIMNKQMKVPSFLLLLSMMIHLYFFGLIGVILSPIHMSLLYGLINKPMKS